MSKRKRRKRKRSKHLKGGALEREICKKLSDWWKPGRDDIFWRSSTSGGRATFRRKQGRNTYGQHGDVAATDPIGEPLLDVATIEIKRGYNATTMFDMLDVKVLAKTHQWRQWIEKAIRDAAAAGSYSWLIINRRDRREELITMPFNLFQALTIPYTVTRIEWNGWVCFSDGMRKMHLVTITLEDFFSWVSPKRIKALRV